MLHLSSIEWPARNAGSWSAPRALESIAASRYEIARARYLEERTARLAAPIKTTSVWSIAGDCGWSMIVGLGALLRRPRRRSGWAN